MRYFPALAVLLSLLVYVGCDSTDSGPSDSEIAEVLMLPDTASIAVGDVRQFELRAVTHGGDTTWDASLDVRWWSTDSTVFSVNDDGIAAAHAVGTAFCMAEVESASKRSARFTGRDSAFVVVFLN